MDATAEATRRATFMLMLMQATRVYLPIRFLALASTSQIAISRAPIDMAGKVTLYNSMMRLAHDFKFSEALRILMGHAAVMPVEAA